MGMQRGKSAPTFYSVDKMLFLYHSLNSWSTQIYVYFTVLIVVQPEMFYQIL